MKQYQPNNRIKNLIIKINFTWFLDLGSQAKSSYLSCLPRRKVSHCGQGIVTNPSSCDTIVS